VRPYGRDLEAGVEAYVLDIGVEPAVRGRGLGRATMLAAERAARDLDATVARLTVLAHNTRARRLYDSLDYSVAGVTATKRLAADGVVAATAACSRLRVTQVAEAGRSTPRGRHRWTAYDGDDPVGTFTVRVEHRSDGPHACVDGFEVREDLRGRGLGRALAVAAERELLTLGARTVRLSVPGPDVAARSLCARRGLTVAALELEKSLG